MRNSAYHLRLFDLKKYRKIQPVLKSIYEGIEDCQQLIPFIMEAKKNVEHDDFEKYNDPDERECYFDDFEEILGILREGNLITWLYTGQDSDLHRHVLANVFKLYCFPNFQVLADENKKLGTKLSYWEILLNSEICQLDLRDVLDNLSSGEVVPLSSHDTTYHILTPQQLADLEKKASHDILTLSALENFQEERHFSLKEIYLTFCFDLQNLINLAKGNDDYTLISESFIA
jgi:hypothetical protein